MQYQDTITVVWAVHFGTGCDGNGPSDKYYFDNEEDANTVAALKLGEYVGTGSVYKERYFSDQTPPETSYKSAKEFAQNRLTWKEAVKFGFIKG